MITIQALNVCIQLWACVLSLLVAVFILQESKPLRPCSRVLLGMAVCQGLLLLSDAVSVLCEGNPSYINRFFVVGGNFVLFVLGYVLLVLFTRYLTHHLEEMGPVSKAPVYIMTTLAVIAIMLVFVSLFNHMYYVVDADNVYIRQDLFWLSQALGMLGQLINAVFLCVYAKRITSRNRLVFALYILLPVVAMAVQVFVYGFPFLNTVNTICIITVYMFIQLDQIKLGHKRDLELAEQQNSLLKVNAELMNTRLNLMAAQIQPHFIFNTLGAIQHLCLTQPKRAAEIVREFSLYLRGNFDELDSTAPVCLSREIEHVKHYTAIEHVRLPDMTIFYELYAPEFFLPALSIQPLVENAIKHGLMGRERGGTVVISTYETDGAYCVCVKDDGVGFDPTVPLPNRGQRHLGINNIRERIRIMCGGTLTVESTPGYGTMALISIPKEGVV